MDLWTDARHAWRSLWGEPGHSLLVIGLLGTGIALTVAVYSMVSAVVLRPLPYPESDRLVQVRQFDTERGYLFLTSGPSYRDMRAGASSVESLSAISGPGRLIMTGAGEATTVRAAAVEGPLFELLGARPALGRLLRAADGEPGASPVAVLSHRLWMGRLGGDTAVLGRMLLLEGKPHEVVGVAEPGLAFPDGAELWTAIPPSAEFMDVRHAHILTVVGRLRPGADPATAAAELNAILDRVPGYEVDARVTLLKDELVGGVRAALAVLMAAVVFVLLIACANVGNLLLARSARRRGELAVRGALGAGRRRLGAQLLVETTLLGLGAGALGLLGSVWAVGGLLGLAPGDLPRAEEIGIDGRVAVFALAVSLAAGLLTGLFPVLRILRMDPGRDLRRAGRRSASERGRLRSAFVVAEVALSVVLLFGAGLLVRSFLSIMAVDPGFRAEQVTTFSYSLPDYRYQEEDAVRMYLDHLVERVEALPMVATAGISQNLPVGGRSMISPAVVEGREGGERPMAQIAAVSSDFFEALGTRVVSGRTFEPRDGPGAPPVAMVNQAFARVYLEGQDPVGRRAHTYFGLQVMHEIVGVVQDAKHTALTEPAPPMFYYSAAQRPPSSGWLVVRSEAPAPAVIAAVRAAAAEIDREVPLGDVATLADLLARTTAEPRFYAVALSTFAAVALLLALIGFYAVLAGSVAGRRREIGVRMAVGARSGEIVEMVVKQGLALTAVGLVLGIAGAIAAGRFLESLLFGVRGSDPLVLAGVVAVLAALALLAAWAPARAAAAVDPVSALRAE